MATFGSLLGGLVADALAKRLGLHGRPLSAQITVAIGIPLKLGEVELWVNFRLTLGWTLAIGCIFFHSSSWAALTLHPILDTTVTGWTNFLELHCELVQKKNKQQKRDKNNCQFRMYLQFWGIPAGEGWMAHSNCESQTCVTCSSNFVVAQKPSTSMWFFHLCFFWREWTSRQNKQKADLEILRHEFNHTIVSKSWTIPNFSVSRTGRRWLHGLLCDHRCLRPSGYMGGIWYKPAARSKQDQTDAYSSLWWALCCNCNVVLEKLVLRNHNV